MKTLILGAIIAGFASWLFTHAARRIAPLVGAMDHPDGFRKLHGKPMPRMGGVPIFLAVLVPLALLILFYRGNYVARDLLGKDYGSTLAGLLGGGAIALFMGFIDDIQDLRPRPKLLFQIAAATLAYHLGFAIRFVGLPLIGGFHLGWLAYPFTLFWFLACMNAINLADGLDGLAAGLALFVTLILAVTGALNQHTGAVFLAAAAAGAIFGFLLHNFHPAKIYLGDSGSMLLGFWIAALGIACSRKATTAISLLVPIIALGIPILDTALAILRRWLRRLPISAGDRQHIHHILLRLGLSHRNAVLLVYATCILLGIVALVTTFANDLTILLLLLALALVAVTFASIFGGVQPGHILQRLAEDMRNRERSSQARIAVSQAVSRIERAPDPDAIWQAMQPVFAPLELDHATLEFLPIHPHAPASRTFRWTSEHQDPVPAASPDSPASVPETCTLHLLLTRNAQTIGNLLASCHLNKDLPPIPEQTMLLAQLRDAIQVNRNNPRNLLQPKPGPTDQPQTAQAHT